MRDDESGDGRDLTATISGSDPSESGVDDISAITQRC